MGIGVVSVVRGKKHRKLRVSEGIGTNNVAEWLGAIYALLLAIDYYEQYDDVECKIYTDSQLIANQFNGHWQVKQKELRPYYNEAQELLKRLPKFHRLNWIPRERNHWADKASKEANPYYSKSRLERQALNAGSARKRHYAKVQLDKLRKAGKLKN